MDSRIREATVTEVWEETIMTTTSRNRGRNRITGDMMGAGKEDMMEAGKEEEAEDKIMMIGIKDSFRPSILRLIAIMPLGCISATQIYPLQIHTDFRNQNILS